MHDHNERIGSECSNEHVGFGQAGAGLECGDAGIKDLCRDRIFDVCPDRSKDICREQAGFGALSLSIDRGALIYSCSSSTSSMSEMQAATLGVEAVIAVVSCSFQLTNFSVW